MLWYIGVGWILCPLVILALLSNESKRGFGVLLLLAWLLFFAVPRWIEGFAVFIVLPGMVVSRTARTSCTSTEGPRPARRHCRPHRTARAAAPAFDRDGNLTLLPFPQEFRREIREFGLNPALTPSVKCQS